ncbi:VOC family protein [Limibaculum sp. M0105]|uniref:VOC family protein n=1 Tax=Thermohalobaculum xanthum TaxID=2753746 RepID=A0A8J7SA30_9RHOB|nr:VOC family protein [Thermohalobaculum xanthum]MBK0398072.1 VOC family protein [Thermohalobaculum xanthum]
MADDTARGVIDHLVVGAASLEAGRRWADAVLGVAPGGSGAHPTMGTVNLLWNLGGAYLEVIAVDPGAPHPGRPRWFGLDDPGVQARIAQRPRLLTWVARPSQPLAEAAAASPVDPGPVERHHRGELFWHLTVARDGHPPLSGAMPSLIEWPEGVAPPPDRLPPCGLALRRLTLPDRPELAAALEVLGVRGCVTIDPGASGLSAVIGTPGGEVTLD